MMLISGSLPTLQLGQESGAKLVVPIRSSAPPQMCVAKLLLMQTAFAVSQKNRVQRHDTIPKRLADRFLP